MAIGKKSFLLYADYISTFEKLTDEEAGKLSKMIFKYVNDLSPEPENRIIELVFEPIKLQLKRDLNHWETVKTVRSENGKKGGRPNKEKAKKANGYLEKLMKAKKAVNVNVNVNDTVIENVNEKKLDNISNWKTDFEFYKNELRKVYKELIADNIFITEQEKFNPNIDIKLSIEKACTNFWATDAGWKHKKKSRSKDLDLKSTLTNAISMNKVYKNTIKGKQLSSQQDLSQMNYNEKP